MFIIYIFIMHSQYLCLTADVATAPVQNQQDTLRNSSHSSQFEKKLEKSSSLNALSILSIFSI